MNRHFVLSFASTAAAVLCAAAMVSGKAYGDDITIDTTPFVSTSTRTRVQVKAELRARPQVARDGGSEWKVAPSAR